MENNETIEKTQDSSTEDVNNEGTKEVEKDWQAEALKYKAIAERKDKQLQDKSVKADEEPNKTNETNEPNYALQALLEVKGVKDADDQKIITDEMARLKLSATDILGMEHIQSKLKNASDQRTAQEGVPDSSGKPGAKSQNDVDYWINSDKTPTDPEMHSKVIEAKMKQDSSVSPFSDIKV